MMGVFENSFYLSNYENSFKSSPKEDKSKDDPEKDERVNKVMKKIGSYKINVENGSVLETEEAKFERASALATEMTRDLCNTRGSVATPEWMEK